MSRLVCDEYSYLTSLTKYFLNLKLVYFQVHCVFVLMAYGPNRILIDAIFYFIIHKTDQPVLNYAS